MKNCFILILSAMMLFACSGNKTQNNEGEESSASDVEASCDKNPQELLLGFISVGDARLGDVEDVDRKEFDLAQEFLMEVICPGEDVDTHSEEWITAHCTSEIKQFLRDKYDYDGEGYAKWLMEGSFAGEAEFNSEVTGFGYGDRHGQPVYSIEKRYSFEGMESFVRNLYFGLQRNGDDFVITSFEINMDPNDPTLKEIL